MSAKDVPLKVMATREFRDRIERAASVTNLSISEFVRRALEREVDLTVSRIEREHAVLGAGSSDLLAESRRQIYASRGEGTD